MSRITVNEGSTSYHAISFTDQSGAPVVPEALRYRLTAGEGAIILDWVDLSSDATEVIVSSEHNIIGSQGAKRYLTIQATHNGGEIITEEVAYTIVNLIGVDGV